jgi:LmbE family N-acetylglucosaminyl deacetylase
MKLLKPTSEIYVPDGTDVDKALERTTHLGIGAHPDDLEIMGYAGIYECFGRNDKWFTGVVTTNGAGSPRAGIYANYTDEEMQKIRRIEQKKAAVVGEYSAVIFLDYSSSEIKSPTFNDPIEDIKQIILKTKPQVIYTHNPADKHDTHVATMVKTIMALKQLPKEVLPKKIYGCECWRDLDWMLDEDKVVFDVSERDNIATSLVGLFDSQISGGKRYDLATMARRRANATFYASHGVDVSTYVIYAIDLTPVITDSFDIVEYTLQFIERFKNDVVQRLKKMM